MPIPLSVLVLQERVSDAERLIAELQRADYAPTWKHVDRQTDYERELDRPYDIIFADYSLPHCNGFRAIQFAREHQPNTPCILVSGTISQEIAAHAIQCGADDYIHKDQLARLRPAVAQALEKKRLRDANRQIEQALQDQTTLFRAMIEHGSDGIILLDAQGVVRFASVSAGRILGFAPDDLVGRSAFDLIHANDVASATQYMTEALAASTPTPPLEIRFLHKEGHAKWTEIRANNRLADPSVRALIINFRDVTERRMAERVASETNALLERMFSTTHLMFAYLDTGFNYLKVNRAYAQATGREPEFYPGKNLFQWLPDFVDRQPFYAVVEAGEPLTVSAMPMQIPGRGTVYWDWSLQPVKEADGRVSAIVLSGLDVTERLRAEEALQHNEKRFRALVEHNGEAIMLFTREGQIFYASPSANKVLGRPIDKTESRAVFAGLHPDDVARLTEIFMGLLTQPGSTAPFQAHIRHPDGAWHWVEGTLTNLLDEPSVAGMVGNVRDITRRKQAEEALWETNELLENVFANTHVGIAYLDRDLKFLRVNQAYANADGQVPEFFVGKSHFELYPNAENETIFRRVVATGEPYFAHAKPFLYAQHPERGTTYWDWSLCPVKDIRGTVVELVLSLLDVTGRKRAEEETDRRIAQLAVINQAGRGLAEALDVPTVCARLSESIRTVLPDTAGLFVSLFDPAREEITCAYGFVEGEVIDPSVLPVLPLDTAGTGTQSEVIRTRRPLIVNDLQARAAASTQFEVGEPGAIRQSSLYAPMLARDGVIGVVQVQSNVPNRYRESDADLLATLANTGAIALENAHLFVETRQRLTELETLAKVSAALRTAQTLDELRSRILDWTLRALNARTGSLFLFDSVNQDFYLATSVGYPVDVSGLRLKQGQGLAGECIQTGKPILVEDISSDPRVMTREAFGGLHKAICYPLNTNEQVVGALLIAFSERGMPNPSEINIVSTVAETAGNAIHRMSLHEQTVRRVAQLQALRSIDSAISNLFDLRLTLDVVLEQVTSQLGADAATIFIYEPHRQTLEVGASRGFRSDVLQGVHLRLGQAYAGVAALERQRVHIPDIRTVPSEMATRLEQAGEGFVSYYAIPLITKGELKGVLEIFHRSRLQPDAGWLDFLDALGGQAAIAIDNISLLDALTSSNNELALAYESTLEGWSRALDLRDKETEGHTQRVTDLSERLARALGVSDEQMIHIRRGALLHDIGKMGVPDRILLKPGPLTEDEWVVMRKHPVYAYELLSPIAFLHPALDIPYCHHEKWDGSGYPRGLKGEQIPLAARLFAVVDVWDAVTSDRPYRPAWSKAQALDHLRAGMGAHFDPRVAERFLDMIRTEL